MQKSCEELGIDLTFADVLGIPAHAPARGTPFVFRLEREPEDPIAKFREESTLDYLMGRPSQATVAPVEDGFRKIFEASPSSGPFARIDIPVRVTRYPGGETHELVRRSSGPASGFTARSDARLAKVENIVRKIFGSAHEEEAEEAIEIARQMRADARAEVLELEA